MAQGVDEEGAQLVRGQRVEAGGGQLRPGGLQLGPQPAGLGVGAGAQRGLGLHALQGRPQPALRGAAGFLRGRAGAGGVGGPALGVVAGGDGRDDPVPGVDLGGGRRRAQLTRLLTQAVVVRAQVGELGTQLGRAGQSRVPSGVGPLGTPSRGRRLLPRRRGPRLRRDPRLDRLRRALLRRSQRLGRLQRLPGCGAGPAHGLVTVLRSLFGRGPRPVRRLVGPLPGGLGRHPFGVGLGRPPVRDLDGRDGVALHLVQPCRHRVQRHGQLGHRPLHRLDVLAQPVGVEPEGRTAAVEAERVQGLTFVAGHLRAGAAALPAGVAAERARAAALGSGSGELGAAAAVAAACGGVDHVCDSISYAL